MATFRIPILSWETSDGHFTSQAITGEEEYFVPAAFAEKKDVAISRVKEYLQWLFEREWWRYPSEYEQLSLLEFRVEVRPEYQVQNQENTPSPSQKKNSQKTKKRTFTSEELIPLKVACVYWKTESGNFFASLPMFEIEFFFNRESELKSLVSLKVQESLRGATPLFIANYLPPKEIWLDEISVHVKHKEKNVVSYKETPTLISVAEPLGAKNYLKKSGKAYERENEVADLVKRLTQEKANILILGESGVGKTTILTEAVKEIERNLLKNLEENEVESEWDEKNPRHRFWQTNGGRIIAGMKYLGQWEERCETIISELSDINGVLCGENLLDLIRYGGSEPSESIAAFLIPYLQNGELRMVVEATPEELTACRRLLPAFADSFQILQIKDFNAEKALSVLSKLADINSQNLKIEYSSNVINLIYRLFSRFMPYRKFPAGVPHFLTSLFEKTKKENLKELTTSLVIDGFVKLTGLPELFLRDEIPLELNDVVSDFTRQVIGQETACRQTAQIVTKFKTGLNDPQKPLGVFLFTGPTGVGKTELVKVLARFFFGHDSAEKDKIIRLDMSEYSLSGSASRLLIKPDGEPSELIQKIREKPFSVVLFDEVEKADAQVFDVLLGLFDEGRLTDRFGRVANFTSAVVVMTSNLGAERFAKGSIGFGENESVSSHKEIKAFFRPEFINRLDSVVQFNPLDKSSLYKITEKEVLAIAKRQGFIDRKLKLQWNREIIEFLAQKGFEPRYGARPLQRAIENLLISPLSQVLIAHPSLKETSVVVKLDSEKTNLVFEF